MSEGTKVMLGNEACAEGAIAAGMDYFAGYPITPASEVAEVLAGRLPQVGGKFIQMEDEIASIGAIIGASLAGAKAMTATSGPGFSLMQENLGFAAMAEIPCVLVNVMRVGPSSGIATLGAQGDLMQVRWGSHGDYPIIALAPASVQEMYDYTVRAFNLAERFRSPVILVADGIVGHMSEKVHLPAPGKVEITYRQRPEVAPEDYLPYDNFAGSIPPMAVYGDGYRWYTTGIVHDETGFPCTNNPQKADLQLRRLLNKFEPYRQEIITTEPYFLEDAEAAILAFGVVARSARAAVKKARAQGLKVGLLRLETLWPFAEEEVRALLDQVKVLVVPEMNAGQLVGEVSKYNSGKCFLHSLTSVNGTLMTSEEILTAVKEGMR